MLFDTTTRNVNVGLPTEYLEKPKKVNSIWGQDYITMNRNLLNEKEIEGMFEAMTIMKELKKWGC